MVVLRIFRVTRPEALGRGTVLVRRRTQDLLRRVPGEGERSCQSQQEDDNRSGGGAAHVIHDAD